KLAAFDAGNCSLTEVLSALRAYEEIYDPKHDHTEVYREVLAQNPWKQCRCESCGQIGHHVMMLRGAERNRRRGFHNIWVFYRRLKREIAEPGAMNSRRGGNRQLELLGGSTNRV